MLALALRDFDLLSWPGFPSYPPVPYLFAIVTIVFAIPSLVICRVSDALRHTFSPPDFLAICAAVAMTIGASGLLLFTLTRLDGVPRSTPLIYSLVLACGLIGGRAFSLLIGHARARSGIKRDANECRRVILIGADRFSWLIIRLLDSQLPATTQIVCVLDERPSAIGRSINGVRITGRIDDLGRIIEEYVLHGVSVDAVWISEHSVSPGGAAFHDVAVECARYGIACLSTSEALNLTLKQPAVVSDGLEATPPDHMGISDIELSSYFMIKRGIDVVVSVLLIIGLAPIWLCVAMIVFLDVGTPLYFWQERVGRNERRFFVYKFRTFQAPYDQNGEVISGSERLSAIGRFIRRTRFDELPQLVNVLVGDMSLIGPRPLLPADQPGDPSMRLTVRPGISGWAQVNGGTLVTVEEKDALDEYYVRNATFGLDLKIAWMTVKFVLGGERRNMAALRRALAQRQGRDSILDFSEETPASSRIQI